MDEGLVLCRLLHYGSAMLLFGASLFQGVLAPPDLAQALDRSLDRVLTLALAIACLTAIAWLFLAAGEMGDGWSDALDPATWKAVLLDTAFGHVWQWHLVFGLLLVARRRLGPTRKGRIAVLASSALFLGSLGLIGHAVLPVGPLGWVDRASHILHLLAAGFWLGSLPPLLPCLTWLGRSALHASASLALRRFSTLGHAAVAVVLVTGALNTQLVLGAWPFDPASPYQALLLAKIGIVAVMVGIALFNRYELVPKLGRGGALRQLRTMTMVEIALGLGALGLVSLLGTLAPT